MAVEKEAGLRSIAEKLQGHWEEVAGWEQWMLQGAGLGCRKVEVRPGRQYWQEAGSCEVELRRERQTV